MSWRVFLSIPAILFALYCQDKAYNPQNKPIPKVEKGVLDLRGWDLEKDGPVALDGDWEFYWKEFVDPASFVEQGTIQNQFSKNRKDSKKDLNPLARILIQNVWLLNP